MNLKFYKNNVYILFLKIFKNKFVYTYNFKIHTKILIFHYIKYYFYIFFKKKN